MNDEDPTLDQRRQRPPSLRLAPYPRSPAPGCGRRSSDRKNVRRRGRYAASRSTSKCPRRGSSSGSTAAGAAATIAVACHGPTSSSAPPWMTSTADSRRGSCPLVRRVNGPVCSAVCCRGGLGTPCRRTERARRRRREPGFGVGQGLRALGAVMAEIRGRLSNIPSGQLSAAPRRPPTTPPPHRYPLRMMTPAAPRPASEAARCRAGPAPIERP